MTKSKIYSDNDLFQFLEEKKQEHFDFLYDKYSSILYGVLLQSGLSEEYAAEILSQTFIQLWTSKIKRPHASTTFLTLLIQLVLENTNAILQKNGRKYSIIMKSNFQFSITFLDLMEEVILKHHIA